MSQIIQNGRYTYTIPEGVTVSTNAEGKPLAWGIASILGRKGDEPIVIEPNEAPPIPRLITRDEFASFIKPPQPK